MTPLGTQADTPATTDAPNQEEKALPIRIPRSVFTEHDTTATGARRGLRSQMTWGRDRIARGEAKTSSARDRIAWGQARTSRARDRIAWGQARTSRARDRIAWVQARTSRAWDRIAWG